MAWTDIENNDTGLSVREKLNTLGALVDVVKADLDTDEAGLASEIATRVSQIATLTAGLAAEITRAQTAEAGKADLVAGKVPTSQLPSYVDAIETYANSGAFPVTGNTVTIYIATDTLLSYRWTGVGYAPVGSGLSLGETSGAAYRGDRGKTAYDHSQLTAHNPHGTTLGMLGAGNSATRNVGTTAGTVAAGDDSRITGAALNSANLSGLTNMVTARANLGLGTLAVENIAPVNKGGTGATTVDAIKTLLGLGTAAYEDVGNFLEAANNLFDLTSQVDALTGLGFSATVPPGAGYFIMPSVIDNVKKDIIVQWQRPVITGTQVVTWGLAFPAVCYSSIAVHGSSGANGVVSSYSETVNNVTVRNTGTPQPVLVFGWGY